MRRTAILRNIRTGQDFVDRSIRSAIDASYRAEAEANYYEPQVVETPAQRVANTPELADVYLSVKTKLGSEELLIKPTAGNPTGLTSIYTHPAPRETLLKVYDHTLAFLGDRYPKSSLYRQALENLTNARREIVATNEDTLSIEEKVGSGLLEEILIQAADEFRLAEDMAENKPWEALEEQPLPGQWTAFAFTDAPEGPR